jgi:phosphomethylpyrimidine synthase
MSYKTQMEAARKGIITPEMEIAASSEALTAEQLREKIALGRVIIPCNKNHTSLIPLAVGENTRTKINVNLGISKDSPDYSRELKMAHRALEMAVDGIMDLSCWGDTRQFRRQLIEQAGCMIGTVPIYDAVGNRQKALKDLDKEDFLGVLRDHVEDGVDFVTIHAGLNLKTAQRIKDNPRLTRIVSRGGSLLFAWMHMTGRENPYYEYFDEVLDILKEYDVTLSLGDGCRPGSLMDAGDAAQMEELITLGELTLRAWERNIQVMVEGPGHVPLHEIKAQMQTAKTLIHGAPFYVLGPLVTDIAPGYDHITGAIGGAMAASYGADFLCYLTPAEHLRLPDEQDMVEGIMASKIAAHAGDMAKGISGTIEKDHAMSRARAQVDWPEMFKLCLDPEKALRYRESSLPEAQDSCTMCGEMCSMKNMNQILQGKEVVIEA